MTHPEIPGDSVCVSASDADLPPTTTGAVLPVVITPDVVSQPSASLPEPPVSVSPSEWVASEGTLIKMLTRHYGWIQPNAHELIRYRRAS